MNVRGLCLAILYFGDATGYEIRKQAQDGVFSYFIEASYGAIYPALGKLTEEGLVSFREEIQSGKPNKKIYSLTPAGKRAFMETLSGDPVEDKFKSEFLLQMMCSELLEPERVEELIANHLAMLEAKLSALQAALEGAGGEGSRFALTCGIRSYGLAIEHLNERAAVLIAQAGSARQDADAGQTPRQNENTTKSTKSLELTK